MKLESLGELAAGIAHEINTPIQFIGSNVSFLRESFTDLLQVIKAYAGLRDTLKIKNMLEYSAILKNIEKLEESADIT